VYLRPITVHPDQRGTFSEIFREEWDTGVRPVQWNVVRSLPGVLRGVHVHLRHEDYLLVIEGRATIGLRDVRDDSPTSGRAATVEVSGSEPRAIRIPTGVAHGFLFHEPSIHIYSVTHFWDPEDELACHWGDPELGIRWNAAPTSLSAHDAEAPPLRDLLVRLRARRGSMLGRAGERPPQPSGQAVGRRPQNRV
jgi:dTDP-4-dehydrorhamnose 3,5-epimerase